jgi:hypothetical protein
MTCRRPNPAGAVMRRRKLDRQFRGAAGLLSQLWTVRALVPAQT